MLHNSNNIYAIFSIGHSANDFCYKYLCYMYTHNVLYSLDLCRTRFPYHTCTYIPCILVFWENFEHVAGQCLTTAKCTIVCSYSLHLDLMLPLDFSYTASRVKLEPNACKKVEVQLQLIIIASAVRQIM